MGCGSSVAVLPEHAITYDNEILDKAGSKDVKSSESYDSGVGYELGSKESSSVSDDSLPGWFCTINRFFNVICKTIGEFDQSIQ